MEGTITAQGRLHRFSSVDDPILHLLNYAGLPLTLNESTSLLANIMRILKQKFRAMPRQALRKPRVAKRSVLVESIVDSVRKTRLAKIAKNLPNAMEPLLENKEIGTILYERFRSESIHGATVVLDSRRFFGDTDVYWKPMHSEYYGSFELIEFPARFLVSMLEQCMKTYRSALLAKGKIPPDVHFYAFGDDVFSQLDCLDESLLPEGGGVRFKIGRNR